MTPLLSREEHLIFRRIASRAISARSRFPLSVYPTSPRGFADASRDRQEVSKHEGDSRKSYLRYEYRLFEYLFYAYIWRIQRPSFPKEIHRIREAYGDTRTTILVERLASLSIDRSLGAENIKNWAGCKNRLWTL